jgi:copper resistance protein C
MGSIDIIGPMRPRLGLLLFLPLLLTAWLVGAGHASAHDELVGSNPAAGTDLHEAPTSLRLTFSDSVNDIGVAVRVEDAAGTQLQTGKPVVDDTVVTQRLKRSKAPGTVHVVWRVTSSDGHPVSGDFIFSVNAADAPKTSAPAKSSSTATGGLQRTTASNDVETSYSTSVPSFQHPTDKTNNEPLLIIGMAVLGALVVGGLAALIRLRARGDDADL